MCGGILTGLEGRGPVSSLLFFSLPCSWLLSGLVRQSETPSPVRPRGARTRDGATRPRRRRRADGLASDWSDILRFLFADWLGLLPERSQPGDGRAEAFYGLG